MCTLVWPKAIDHCSLGQRPRTGGLQRFGHALFGHALFGFAWCLLLVAAVPTAFCAAAAPVEKPIHEREPYDEIRLNQANQHAVLQVEPLELPGHQLPANRSGKLRVRLSDRPGSEYEVAWDDIDAVTFYAQLILEEAQQLAKAGRFDDAYHAFRRLLEAYPETPGLGAAVEDFLLQNADASYRAKKYDDALELMLELHARNPQHQGVSGKVDALADKLISRYVADNNFVAGRGILETLAERFPNGELPLAAAWRSRLIDRATILRDRARQRLAAGGYNEALEDCRRALAVWPSVPGVHELALKIGRAYPHLTVGVILPTPRVITRRLDDWASLRAARLVSRSLAELSGYNAEGSRYTSPFGTLQLDESELGFDVVLRHAVRFPGSRQILTGYAVSQQLLAVADPNRGPVEALWSELLGAVSIEDVFRVRMKLTRRNVRPAALLAILPLATGVGNSLGSPASTGPYVVAQRAAERVRYVLGGGSFGTPPPHLKQITERRFADSQAALRALRRGTIDLIDRVAPWDVAALKRVDGVRIGSYALPTAHVLIANSERPLTATRTLRRALCYGIHRQAILDRVILGGTPRAGFELLSGPFLRGRSLDDPIGAAADRQIDPYPYEPRLALILAMVAAREVAAKRAKADRQRALVLAFRPAPLAKIVCEALQAHLKIVDIPVELKPLGPKELDHPLDHADLLYAELALWEPVVDAFRLFGEGGLVGATSPYMNLALGELARAQNWNEARDRLRAIDRIAHAELTVIPLWQTVNEFAYRQSVRGVLPHPVTLYQGVEQWRTADTVQR
jgi:tetratricopeptide (TPR) repeat protein